MRRDGTLIDVEISAAPIRDFAGNATAHMAVFTDISDRKRHEEEVRASRARIVAAGDDARRKLERNLHDGAQQRLVALSVSLRLAESARDDPRQAATILAAAREELDAALEELASSPAASTRRSSPIAACRGRRGARRTARRSPVGVERRRRSAAARGRGRGLLRHRRGAHERREVRGSVDGARHGRRENGRVVVEVGDDGVGGADPAQGSGLRGLADRVAALDGTLSSEPPGGGTAVRAEIPISDASGAERTGSSSTSDAAARRLDA